MHMGRQRRQLSLVSQHYARRVVGLGCQIDEAYPVCRTHSSTSRNAGGTTQGAVETVLYEGSACPAPALGAAVCYVFFGYFFFFWFSSHLPIWMKFPSMLSIRAVTNCLSRLSRFFVHVFALGSAWYIIAVLPMFCSCRCSV